MLERTGTKIDFSKLPEEPWYELREPLDVAMSVWAVLGYLQDNYNDKRDTILRNMRLYGGNSVEGYGPYTYNRMPNNPFRASDRLSLNIIASNIDTYVSKMAKNTPRSRFLTNGGNYSQQRRAKRLQEFMDGIFYQLKLREVSLDQVRDSCVFGTGLVYFYREGNEVKVERVFPGEVFTDPKQSLYGDPREYFRVKYVDRAVLLAMHEGEPDVQRLIAETDPVEDPSYTTSSYTFQRDTIQVVMAWHRPSKEGAKDGRFITCVADGVLRDKPYDRDMSPFCKLLWKKPMVGYWGKGIADELTGLQIEINKLLKKIQDAQHLLGVPWVLRPAGSRTNPSHIQNIPGLILDYHGDTPPTVVTHRTVNPEIYQHLQRLIDYSYEITGISQLAAGSEKPPGLSSGVALQEYSDIGTERFQDQGRRFEDMVAIDYSKYVMAIAEEICADKESGGDCEVNAIHKASISRIKWSQAGMDLKSVVIQVYPTSGLPTHPAAKQERVMNLMDAQIIDKSIATSLLDFPDLLAYTDRRDAPIEDIKAVIEILEDGKYESPEPFTDLKRARPMVQASYLRARREGAPEEVLENFRRYMLELDAQMKRNAAFEQQQTMMAQMAAQAQAGPGPAGAAPGGAPAPPAGPPPAAPGPPPPAPPSPAPTQGPTPVEAAA